MRGRQYQTFDILTAANSTGAGETINVRDYDTIMLGFATDGGGDANLTALVQGTIAIKAPDFDAVQSASNLWTYLECIDTFNGDLKDGNVGFAVSSADGYKIFEVNTNGLTFLTVNITARTEGELTVVAGLFE